MTLLNDTRPNVSVVDGWDRPDNSMLGEHGGFTGKVEACDGNRALIEPSWDSRAQMGLHPISVPARYCRPLPPAEKLKPATFKATQTVYAQADKDGSRIKLVPMPGMYVECREPNGRVWVGTIYTVHREGVRVIPDVSLDDIEEPVLLGWGAVRPIFVTHWDDGEAQRGPSGNLDSGDDGRRLRIRDVSGYTERAVPAPEIRISIPAA